jgi:lantibiotic leader peptide-processing serine protease
MRSMRRPVIAALVAAAAFGVVQSTSSAGSAPREYVVLYERGASAAQAREAVEDAGGRIVSVNSKIGVATVRSSNKDFRSDAVAEKAIVGAAANRPIGHAPKSTPWQPQWSVERAGGGGRSKVPAAAPKEDPFAGAQWDMKMIGATADGSYRKQPGSKKVRVGIIDTGIDASHPDIAPNFDADLSRNFVTDMVDIDGPCEESTCHDPADVDQGGHGTHVAGTVGAALNGVGVAGVAPKVDLVNLRAGQDSGYFFLQASVNALTYAGDHGIDVVNMSYYIDPWLYNCTDNPADSPEAQAEQAAIIEATQRAVDYAHEHNVTLIGAAGNEHTDLGNPTFDDTSPYFPPESAYPRNVDNSCLDMPTEANNVLSISAVGPSGRKAYYSNYGVEQTSVAAPGGDFYDFPGTNKTESAKNLVLAPYPRRLAREAGEITKDFESKSAFVKVDCQGKKRNKKNCAVYQYLQGTSMASPHVTGVVALIISQFGTPDASGLTMDPAAVQQRLEESATDTPCPSPNPYVYPNLDPEFTALCEDPPDPGTFNGFYGHGIVDALAAVSGP